MCTLEADQSNPSDPKEKIKSEPVTVFIDTTKKISFSGSSIKTFKQSENHVMSHVLNLIIKDALRETNLIQIGKKPQFFDESKSYTFADVPLV